METKIFDDYEKLLPTSSDTALADSMTSDTFTSSPRSTTAIEENLRIQIDRPVYDHEKFDEEFDFVAQSSKFSLDCSRRKVLRFAKSLLPPLTWIPKYKKSYFLRDVIAGLTICVLSIPQSMAYATLANVPAVIGLYSSCWPTVLYAIFGTSKHIMFGMFAVPALMVGTIIDDYTHNLTVSDPVEHDKEAIQLCATITFCLAIIFAIMAIARLHVLTAYLSNHLVTGFTTAASFHVLFSQLPKLVSIKIPAHNGFFKLGYITRDLILGLKNCNVVALKISTITIAILMIGRYVINPKVTDRYNIPIPFELIVVVSWTLLSYFFQFHDQYHIGIVSEIPKGLPPPVAPDFSRVFELFPRAIPIAVVIFGVTLSVGKMFAKKHNYKVNPAQDLRAMSLIHFICCFFQCHPCSGSLSRGVVASQMGSKSQIAGITAASIVLVVILWAAPWLYHLPKCVLASIIFVALQSLFMKVNELPKLWKTSKIDFAIWVVACVTTTFYDVTEGLVISVVFALFTIILRTQVPKSICLAKMPGTEIYRDVNKYPRGERLENILILRYDAPLLFVNAQRFVETAAKLVAKEYLGDAGAFEDLSESEGDQTGHDVSIKKNHHRYLIVDLSGVAQVDQMGVEALKDLHHEVDRLGATVLMAQPKSPVRELFAACELFSAVPKTSFFPSIHDAVIFAQSHM